MAVTKIKPVKSTLSKALDYIQNPDKTDGKILVSSFGCSYETADIEFAFTPVSYTHLAAAVVQFIFQLAAEVINATAITREQMCIRDRVKKVHCKSPLLHCRVSLNSLKYT